MSAMSRLSVTMVPWMGTIPRDLLRRGVLHVNLAPRPMPWSAGHQPPFSGLHFSHWHSSGSTLLQFPPEILKQIVGYLEPIWLFQVAAAYPQIHELLGFETANRIWYDAIPAALFPEPENFQDEALVKDRMLAYSKGAEVDATLQLSKVPFANSTYYYHPVHCSRFVLPEVTNMSEMALKVEFPFDVGHPKDRRFYPTTPTRIRVMALGGPFQPWMDYRQELAGHLHYGMRCLICLEVCGKFRNYRRLWGFLWCDKCYDCYMLTPGQVAEIPGLSRLVKLCSRDSSFRLSVLPVDYQYRPMIDEILRNQIGIDFETAAAKQQYIGQLLETTKGGALSMQLKINRCLLRQRIVACAQRVWARAAVNENDREDATDGTSRKRLLATQMMVLARERWGPTALLPTFLFPARSLCTSKFLYPYDDKARWLPDPTHTLQTSRDVLRAGPDWIGQKATEMLEGLLVHRAGDAVTAWTEAAEKWHYQRLKNDLYMGKYLNFGYGGARLRELTDQTSKDINRLDVIAKKLRIDPLFPVGSLTDQEKRMAVASFNKILQHRCGGCPLHNFLIVPLGLAQVVQHHREHHPLDFWLNDNWMIRG